MSVLLFIDRIILREVTKYLLKFLSSSVGWNNVALKQHNGQLQMVCDVSRRADPGTLLCYFEPWRNGEGNTGVILRLSHQNLHVCWDAFSAMRWS